jgi:exonuclease III
LTLNNTSSFLTWSVQLIFILLQQHISKLSGYFWSAAQSVLRVTKIYSEGRSRRFLWILGIIIPDYTTSHSRNIAVRLYNERVISYYIPVRDADNIACAIELEWLRKYNKTPQSYEMVIRIAGRAMSSEERTA